MFNLCWIRKAPKSAMFTEDQHKTSRRGTSGSSENGGWNVAENSRNFYGLNSYRSSHRSTFVLGSTLGGVPSSKHSNEWKMMSLLLFGH